VTPASAVPRTQAPGLAGSLLTGVAIALLVALLPALRHADQFVLLWLGCAGSGALVLGPALFGARVALPEWRALLPLACGLGIAVGPVMLLGRLIKTATHHRPLGAMTYAVVACVAVLCAWVLAWRLLQLAGSSSIGVRRASRASLGALLAASLSLASVSCVALGSGMGPVVVDVAALLVLSFFGLRAGIDLKLGAVPPLVAWLVWGLAVGGGGLMTVQVGPLAATASLPLSAIAAVVMQ